MSVRRVGWLAAIAVATILSMSCGQVFRPVVLPLSTTPPNPSNFHAVFGVSANVPANPGSVFQIDVAGDSNIGQANMGVTPTHAAILPNNSRVFVASAGSLVGDADIVTAFTPASDSTIATGLGIPTTFTMPNFGPQQSASITSISEAGSVVTVTLSSPLGLAQVGGAIVIAGVTVSGPNPSGYDGNFTISSVSGPTIQYTDSIQGLASGSGGTATVPLPTFCQYLPDFVATAQTNAVYVANFGAEAATQPNCTLASTDSVALLNPLSNTITNIAYLPAGAHPVALAETPNAQNLYVVNQANNTVTDLSPTDLSTIATIPVGITPVWAVARADNQRVYVLTQGDGMLAALDTNTNTVLATFSVGTGANFILYDSHLNRLYVTNPTSGTVYVFSDTGGASDTPNLLSTISMTAGANPPCPAACSPVSVAALPDGSRFYVASYEAQTACSDPTIGTSAPCIVPILTVFDALSLTAKPVSSTLLSPSPSLSLLAAPQFAVPPVASCAPAATYAPGSTRFRMFTAAAADSSHVYVSICDAGTIADVSTATNTIATGSTNAPDTLVGDLPAPFSAGAAGSNGEPPPQNPIFLLTGQ